MHSYSLQWNLVAKGGVKTPFADASGFLEYCRQLGRAVFKK